MIAMVKARLNLIFRVFSELSIKIILDGPWFFVQLSKVILLLGIYLVGFARPLIILHRLLTWCPLRGRYSSISCLISVVNTEIRRSAWSVSISSLRSFQNVIVDKGHVRYCFCGILPVGTFCALALSSFLWMAFSLVWNVCSGPRCAGWIWCLMFNLGQDAHALCRSWGGDYDGNRRSALSADCLRISALAKVTSREGVKLGVTQGEHMCSFRESNDICCSSLRASFVKHEYHNALWAFASPIWI